MPSLRPWSLRRLFSTAFIPVTLPCIFPLVFLGCDAHLGDPASAALAILSKRPATYSERLIAFDALVRQSQKLPPAPAFAESLVVHRKRLQSGLPQPLRPETALRHLQSFVYDSLGIRPIDDTASVALSLPSAVLENRRGSCVGLALLFLAYADGLTWPLRPVFMPSHVTLRYETEASNRPYLETLRPFITRDSLFYDSAFSLPQRAWYASQKSHEPDQALLTLAFNFANALRDQGQQRWADELYVMINARLPGFPESHGNLAQLRQASGQTHEADSLWQIALAGDSLAAQRRSKSEVSTPTESSH